jgi:hypothetical protein
MQDTRRSIGQSALPLHRKGLRVFGQLSEERNILTAKLKPKPTLQGI